MNNTKTFFDEQIAQRWPDWEPTGPQIEDWENLIRPYHREDVQEAIRKLAYERDYKTPSLSIVRKNLKAYNFARPVFVRHLFIQRDNGEFSKIYIRDEQGISDEFLVEMGFYWTKRFEEMYQGKWIAFTGVTDWDMCAKRREIRKAMIDGNMRKL